ncbi:MAG: hypothetical protein AB1489_43615 [Acidobacteriota bacterium]
MIKEWGAIMQVMNPQHYNEKELLQQMFSTVEQNNEKLQAAWREFFARYEETIMDGIKQTCREYMPELKLTPITIGALLHRVLMKLADDDYKELRTFQYSRTNTIRFYLHALAVNMVLDFLGLGLGVDKVTHLTSKHPLIG